MTVSAAPVAITVLLFAQLRGRFDADEFTIHFPPGATGRDVMAWLMQRDPKMSALLAVSRLAVNGEYAPWETVVVDGDEVAVIPPVSGGC